MLRSFDYALIEDMRTKGQTAQLRKGRITSVGSIYFTTAVTYNRNIGLANETIYKELIDSLELLENNKKAIPLMWMLMPDHMHGIFRLTSDLSPGKVVGFVKGRMTPILREFNLLWQKNLYEHRLRPAESISNYLQYVLVNPYRAELISFSRKWPYLYCNKEEIEWFLNSTNEGKPCQEWLFVQNPITHFEQKRGG